LELIVSGLTNVSREIGWLFLISSIFYEHLFRTKVFCAAFMCLQLGVVIFWQKDFGAKAAHKMLVKLTPGGSIGGVIMTSLGDREPVLKGKAQYS
jgi:hypothetical protein